MDRPYKDTQRCADSSGNAEKVKKIWSKIYETGFDLVDLSFILAGYNIQSNVKDFKRLKLGMVKK